MRTVTSIELRSATDGSVVPLPDGEDSIAPYVTKFEVTDVLSEFGRQETKGVIEMGTGCPPVAADPPIFTHRRVIRVNLLDHAGVASFEEFRIVRFTRNISGDGSPRMDVEPIWMDLHSTVSRRVIEVSPPRVDLEWYLVGVTPLKALQEIMARGAPSGWEAGSVPTDFDDTPVFLHCIGNSPLDMLRALCADVAARSGMRCEWDYAWSGTAYEVSLTTQLGGTINHPVEGHKEGGEVSEWNRREMSSTLDATRFFTRVVPIGGPDGETGSVQDVKWRVANSVHVAVILEGRPLYVDSQTPPVSLKLETVDGTKSSIVRLLGQPSIVTVADSGLFVVGDEVRFVMDDVPLSYVADWDTELVAGIKERPYRRSDIPPYRNLLVESGVSADLSSWQAAPVLPEGVTVMGATVTRETDQRYVSAGTSAMRVEGGAGDYVETADIDLTGTGPTSGYTSVWVNMRVLSGSFRLALIGPDGAVYPPDQEAVGVAEEQFRGLSLGGLHPPEADGYKVRLTALEDDTEFIVDSWTVTRSSGPFDYSEDMGPEALWNAAGGLLANEGGVLPERVEGSWIDLSQIEGENFDPPTIGARIMVKDAGVDREARLAQVRRKYADGVLEVMGTLGQRPADVTSFLARRQLERRRRPLTPDPVSDVAGDLLAQVSVENGRTKPVLRIVYKEGVTAIRIEVPIVPDPLPDDYVAAEGGPHGRAPAPIPAATAVTKVAILGREQFAGGVLFGDALNPLGGEVSYVAGETRLTDGTVEAPLGSGEVRGEYRVFALR